MESSDPGGLGASSGLAIFYGRPLGGGTGGIYERALNLQPGVPFDPPVGSSQSARDVSAASFQSVDSLIISYVDNYLQGLSNRDTSGNTSVSITGNDDVGSYTFAVTISYNYQETGNPLGTFSVNDTDSMSYSFHETGVSADGVSFTLNDNGSANSTSKLSPTGSTGGTHTLTNVLTGSSTYTLIESLSQTGSLSPASGSDTVSLQDAGSDTYTLSEHRTVTVNGSNQILSGLNLSSFNETENDSWTTSSWAETPETRRAAGRPSR